jgi:predicted ester cyclase
MKTIKIATVMLGFAVSTVGCKKDDKADEAEPKAAPSVTTPTTGADSAKTTPKAEPAKAWTGEDTAKAFQECWAGFNAKDEAVAKKCYADDAEFAYVEFVPAMAQKGADAIGAMQKMWWGGFPDAKGETQLLLVNGANYAAINLMTQTNTGEMMGMPASGKKTVTFEAQSGSLNEEGKVKTDYHYADQATMAHQMGMHTSERSPDSETAWPEQLTVIAANDDKEKANIKFLEDLDKTITAEGFPAMLAVVADDIQFRYVGDKNTVSGKADYEKGMKEWTTMVKMTGREVKSIWAAGDWVFVSSNSTSEMLVDMPGAEGTKGKPVTLTQTEFFKIADGKIKKHWIFENTMQYPVQLGLMDPAKMGGGHEQPAAK